MWVRDSGGAAGHFVGLDPRPAAALAGVMGSCAADIGSAAHRVGALLDEAGPDGGGAATPSTLAQAQRWLDTAATDVRWRITMLEATGHAGSGGLLLAALPFSSALMARAAGIVAGRDIRQALRAYLDADDEDRDAALQHYLDVVRTSGLYADDPAWTGGLIDALGSDGVGNALHFASVAEEGAVAGTREIVAPLATALATAMRHRTARPEVRSELLHGTDVSDLALLLAMAPPETGFLVSAARRMFVTAPRSDAPADYMTDREYVFVLEALAENPEASFRFLTSPADAEASSVAHMLQPQGVFSNPEATVAAGRVLERGLVEYPAGRDAWTWNRAVGATEDAIEYLAMAGHHLKWTHPQFNASVASLLRPHLDAVAVIGAESSGVDRLDYELGVALGGGRRSLSVAPETLRDFLGEVMQQDSGVAHVQLLVGAYSQSPSVQSNRVVLLDGPAAELGPFIEDSLRIAGLAGVVGQGLDLAGHDEESRSRFLTGAFRFATGQGAKQIPTKTPALWLAQHGANYLTGHLVRQFSDWVETFEPMEGEEGVDAFLDAYVATTGISLSEHMAQDPALAALPAHERAETLRVAMALVQAQVGEGLRPVYADLVGETAGK